MNEISLSKSKYCTAIACFKKLWMQKYKPEMAIKKARDAVFKNGTEVGIIAKGLFGKYENVEYNKDLNVMIKKTEELLREKYGSDVDYKRLVKEWEKNS